MTDKGWSVLMPVKVLAEAKSRLAGLAGLIADSVKALEILVVFTIFLWLTATIWHVLTIGSEP